MILDEQIFKNINGKIVNAIEDVEEEQLYEIAPLMLFQYY